MAVIAVGLIALVTLFPVGLRSSRLAGDFTTASFIAQQALDNIRASAQVYDPNDVYFNNTNRNGVGYYDLPISAVKCDLSPVRFPAEPVIAQTWTITITGVGATTTFSVTGSRSGLQGNTGTVGYAYSSDKNEILFALYDNRDGPYFSGVFDSARDVNYPEFATGDEIVIRVELVGGAPYYWYAMRAPVTEDLDLDGILDGRLPSGVVRGSPHDQVQEDVGLDLVPDFYDTDMRSIGTGTAGYQAGLDRPGEFGAVAYPADPHGDNRHPYNLATGWWGAAILNPDGTEGNGKIDAQPNAYIQNVTVVVGWREGGQDRDATFTAAIPNQFR